MFQVEQGHQRMICPADTTTRPILNVGTFTTVILGVVLNIFFPTLATLSGQNWPVGQEAYRHRWTRLIDC